MRVEVTDAHVSAAAKGDPDALNAIYRGLAPPVLGYLRAHAVDDPEALTNDVFVDLLPKIPRVTGGADGLRRLAFTIAHARMVDSIRGRVRSGVSVAYESAMDSRVVASAEDDAQVAMSVTHVQDILALLPSDQREVLTLRVVADLSIDQVAAVIGRSPGAVKQLQRRGLISLRRALQERRVTL